ADASGAIIRRFSIQRDSVRGTQLQMDSVRDAAIAALGGPARVRPDAKEFIAQDIERIRVQRVVAAVRRNERNGAIALLEVSRGNSLVHLFNDAGIYLGY